MPTCLPPPSFSWKLPLGFCNLASFACLFCWSNFSICDGGSTLLGWYWGLASRRPAAWWYFYSVPNSERNSILLFELPLPSRILWPWLSGWPLFFGLSLHI